MIFFEKVEVFSSFGCMKNRARKTVCWGPRKKEAFKYYKKKCLQITQIRIFPNGLVHGFGQKFKISLTLIFMQNRPRKSICERSS